MENRGILERFVRSGFLAGASGGAALTALTYCGLYAHVLNDILAAEVFASNSFPAAHMRTLFGWDLPFGGAWHVTWTFMFVVLAVNVSLLLTLGGGTSPMIRFL